MEEFLIFVFKSAGLLSLFFLCYFILLKRDTSFITNRKFLLGGIVTAAVLPAVYFTKTVYVEAASSPSFILTEGDLTITEVAAEPALSTLEIFFFIYLLGVVVLLARLFIQLFSLIRVLYSGNVFRKGSLKYVETSRKVAPFSFLNYIVYNPVLHSDIELQHILKHEEVHVSQWHTLDVLLANLNLLYQWFNPFAWFYLRNLQQNLEFIADREAVKAVPCKKEYQKALVKISVENFNLALTNNFYQSLIKKRILMLNNPSRSKNTSWKAVLILPLLLVFFLLFNVRTEAQVREQQDTQAATRSSDATITLTIYAETKQEQLDLYKKLAEKHNVLLEFKDVQFNEAGLLTAITASFLDKNNNSNGSISREDPEGIKKFQFYFSPNDGTGFRSGDSATARTAQNSLHQLEIDPLYIIKNKTYSSAQLDGKAIRIEGEVTAVRPEEAIKKYGSSAKSGALVIPNGTIIDDFEAELKEIDRENAAVLNEYVQITKGEIPAVIKLKNSPDTYDVIKESRPSSAGKVINIRNLNPDGKKPMYILNGRIVKPKDSLLAINQENIDSIHVLKGKSAISLYGKDAKDGAILITTKKDSTANSGSTSLRRFGKNKIIVSTGPNFTKDRSLSITSARSTKNDSTIRRDSSFMRFREFRVNKDSVDIIATQNGTRTSPSQQFIITGNESQPLYIVNGKEMGDSFEVRTLDPENISAINVLKDGSATRKYGEKAKNGVIIITTKDAEKANLHLHPNLAVVNATTTEKQLTEIKSRLKNTGVTVKFEDISRNKEGFITSLKISARTSKQNGSATFEVNDGIPTVYVGLLNDKLVVSSNPPGR